jgi:type VI secretion system protein ImpH
VTQGDAKGEVHPRPRPAPSALDRLKSEPARFSLDQAAAVMAPGIDPTEIDFRTPSKLGFASREVTDTEPDTSRLTTPVMGLVGPGGVMPRHYTAWVEAEERRRSTALHGFFDMLSRRFVGLFVKAGARYRPTRDPAPAERVLAAAVGLGTPHLTATLSTPLQALLFHAGALSSRARSAERLRGMLAEEAGCEVRIVEFAGSWVRLPPPEQSRLAAPGMPGRHVQLGVDVAAGVQVWDASARFLIHMGPMSGQDFEKLLPGAPLHTRLVELTRLFVGPEVDFAFNPVLAAGEVPAMQLPKSGARPARLGWTSWLATPRPRPNVASEAILRA